VLLVCDRGRGRREDGKGLGKDGKDWTGLEAKLLTAHPHAPMLTCPTPPHPLAQVLPLVLGPSGLGGSVAGLLDPGALLRQLVQLVLVPTLAGAAVRAWVPGATGGATGAGRLGSWGRRARGRGVGIGLDWAAGVGG
jgi:hypothetical protein